MKKILSLLACTLFAAFTFAQEATTEEETCNDPERFDKEAKKMCYSLLSFMLNDSKEMILNRFRNKKEK